MEIIFLLIGILIGAVIIFLYTKLKFKATAGIPKEELDKISVQLNDLKIEKSKSDEKNIFLVERLTKTENELNNEREKSNQFSSLLSAKNNEIENLNLKISEEKNEIDKIQQKFSIEFKNLANEILEDKSKKFTELNKTNLSDILLPFGEKLADLKQKVEDTYEKESKQRTILDEHIKSLAELNKRVTEEANNLATALKGQSKTQGNWGELVLDRLLELSGLEKNINYFEQESIKDNDGREKRPDIIVKLPDEKIIIVDSKVSLNAYEKFSNTLDVDEKEIALKEHIRSIRNHIKDLSSKEYQNLPGMRSPDFVLMFIPIEPAFSLAVQWDSQLWEEAFQKNIIIVSTTTLLATLKTVASIWKIEKQNRNVEQIAKTAGILYDKFTRFVDDLKKIGKSIEDAEKNYLEAFKKLSEGKGNILSTANKLKELGAKTTKSLPSELLESDEESNELNL